VYKNEIRNRFVSGIKDAFRYNNINYSFNSQRVLKAIISQVGLLFINTDRMFASDPQPRIPMRKEITDIVKKVFASNVVDENYDGPSEETVVQFVEKVIFPGEEEIISLYDATSGQGPYPLNRPDGYIEDRQMITSSYHNFFAVNDKCYIEFTSSLAEHNKQIFDNILDIARSLQWENKNLDSLTVPGSGEGFGWANPGDVYPETLRQVDITGDMDDGVVDLFLTKMFGSAEDIIVQHEKNQTSYLGNIDGIRFSIGREGNEVPIDNMLNLIGISVVEDGEIISPEVKLIFDKVNFAMDTFRSKEGAQASIVYVSSFLATLTCDMIKSVIKHDYRGTIENIPDNLKNLADTVDKLIKNGFQTYDALRENLLLFSVVGFFITVLAYVSGKKLYAYANAGTNFKVVKRGSKGPLNLQPEEEKQTQSLPKKELIPRQQFPIKQTSNSLTKMQPSVPIQRLATRTLKPSRSIDVKRSSPDDPRNTEENIEGEFEPLPLPRSAESIARSASKRERENASMEDEDRNGVVLRSASRRERENASMGDEDRNGAVLRSVLRRERENMLMGGEDVKMEEAVVAMVDAAEDKAIVEQKKKQENEDFVEALKDELEEEGVSYPEISTFTNIWNIFNGFSEAMVRKIGVGVDLDDDQIEELKAQLQEVSQEGEKSGETVEEIVQEMSDVVQNAVVESKDDEFKRHSDYLIRYFDLDLTCSTNRNKDCSFKEIDDIIKRFLNFDKTQLVDIYNYQKFVESVSYMFVSYVFESNFNKTLYEQYRNQIVEKLEAIASTIDFGNQDNTLEAIIMYENFEKDIMNLKEYARILENEQRLKGLDKDMLSFDEQVQEARIANNVAVNMVTGIFANLSGTTDATNLVDAARNLDEASSNIEEVVAEGADVSAELIAAHAEAVKQVANAVQEVVEEERKVSPQRVPLKETSKQEWIAIVGETKNLKEQIQGKIDTRNRENLRQTFDKLSANIAKMQQIVDQTDLNAKKIPRQAALENAMKNMDNLKKEVEELESVVENRQPVFNFGAPPQQGQQSAFNFGASQQGQQSVFNFGAPQQGQQSVFNFGAPQQGQQSVFNVGNSLDKSRTKNKGVSPSKLKSDFFEKQKKFYEFYYYIFAKISRENNSAEVKEEFVKFSQMFEELKKMYNDNPSLKMTSSDETRFFENITNKFEQVKGKMPGTPKRTEASAKRTVFEALEKANISDISEEEDEKIRSQVSNGDVEGALETIGEVIERQQQTLVEASENAIAAGTPSKDMGSDPEISGTIKSINKLQEVQIALENLSASKQEGKGSIPKISTKVPPSMRKRISKFISKFLLGVSKEKTEEIKTQISNGDLGGAVESVEEVIAEKQQEIIEDTKGAIVAGTPPKDIASVPKISGNITVVEGLQKAVEDLRSLSISRQDEEQSVDEELKDEDEDEDDTLGTLRNIIENDGVLVAEKAEKALVALEEGSKPEVRKSLQDLAAALEKQSNDDSSVIDAEKVIAEAAKLISQQTDNRTPKVVEAVALAITNLLPEGSVAVAEIKNEVADNMEGLEKLKQMKDALVEKLRQRHYSEELIDEIVRQMEQQFINEIRNVMNNIVNDNAAKLNITADDVKKVILKKIEGKQGFLIDCKYGVRKDGKCKKRPRGNVSAHEAYCPPGTKIKLNKYGGIDCVKKRKSPKKKSPKKSSKKSSKKSPKKSSKKSPKKSSKKSPKKSSKKSPKKSPKKSKKSPKKSKKSPKKSKKSPKKSKKSPKKSKKSPKKSKKSKNV
jgi:hypothetical protein